MTRVLHILDVSFPVISGYSTRSKCILSSQREIGINPIALTSPHHICSECREFIDGIEYFRTNTVMESFLSSMLGFNEILFIRAVYKRILEVAKVLDFDLIHAHSPSLLGLASIWAAKRLDVGVVYEIRAFWEDAAVASNKYSEKSIKYHLTKKMETYVCKHVDRVVTISLAMKDDLISRGINKDKLFFVPNGVDSHFFESKEKDHNLLDSLGLDKKLVFGYIGTFYDFEGVEDLIQAFVKLYGENNDAALLLVGGGERESEIRTQLERINVDYIVYAGKIPHEKVMAYYSAMDIMVYPRKSTRVTEMTTPLKPLEAMALGKPVICSSVGGLVELIGADNGLFFSPGRHDEMVDCCLQLIRNPLLRNQLKVNGKKRALQERTWRKIIERYRDVYETNKYLS